MNQKVSVIVPSYNQALYLGEALASVYGQSYSNWECLIIDDGSTDSSDEVAKQWTEKDSRFRYFKIKNGGVSHARNFGINKSEGEYILPLDGDDKISPGFLEETVRALEQDSLTKLVYTKTELFGDAKGKWAFKKYSYKRLLYENVMCCTALYKKTDFQKTIGYNENMKKGLEDWDFWLSFLDENSKVVKVKHSTLFYRRKKMSRSAKISSEDVIALRRQIVKNHPEIYEKYLPDIITVYRENRQRKIPFRFELKTMAIYLINKIK